MAGKSTKKSTKTVVEDEELDEEEEGEEEAEAEAAPAKPKKADPRAAPVPAGEFRWEDPSTLRQLDAKWVFLWFVIPIIAVIVYGMLVSN